MLKFVSVGEVRRVQSMLELHESGEVSVDRVSGARSVLKFVSVGEVCRARSMLKLHGSGEVSVDRVRGARSMLKFVSVGEVCGTRSVLDLHESHDGNPRVDLEGEKLEVERGTVARILSEIERGIVERIVKEVERKREEFEGGSAGLGSKVFLTQSITGLTRSRKGILRIIACAPIGATVGRTSHIWLCNTHVLYKYR